MGQALLGIGAAAAGAYGGGYADAQLKRQKSQLGDIDIQSAKDTMEGQAAWANAAKLAGLPQQGASALAGVGGGGQPGQGPPGMPQQPPGVQLQGNRFVPQQGPPMPQMRGGMMPMPQGMPQGSPQLGAPPSPGMVNPGRIGNQPQNLTGPAIMPQQAPSAGLTPAAAPGGGGPPSSSPPPPGGLRGREQLDPTMQGRGQMSQPTHMMTAQQMAQWIAQHNPGLAPGALAKAVEFGMKQSTPENRIAYLEARLQQQSIENALNRESHEKIAGEQIGSREAIAANRAGGTSARNAPAIVEAIIKGDQPPSLTNLRNETGDVRAGLAKQGFNLSKAQIEWDRARKQVQSLNGPQMTRFVGLAESVNSTIDEVRELSKQMDLSGVPKLNRLELMAYMQTQGNSENGKLATRYVSAVNTLKEEFANLANGGYAPTEPAWKLANEQINGNYGVGQLDASLTEIQRLINYRLQGIPNIGTLGAGAPNRYTGENKPLTTPKKESTPGLPEGWSVQEH